MTEKNYPLLKHYAEVFYKAKEGSIRAGLIQIMTEDFIKTLPYHLRRFAFMRYFCGMSFNQISRVLKVSVRSLYYLDEELREL